MLQGVNGSISGSNRSSPGGSTMMNFIRHFMHHIMYALTHPNTGFESCMCAMFWFSFGMCFAIGGVALIGGALGLAIGGTFGVLLVRTGIKYEDEYLAMFNNNV